MMMMTKGWKQYDFEMEGLANLLFTLTLVHLNFQSFPALFSKFKIVYLEKWLSC